MSIGYHKIIVLSAIKKRVNFDVSN